MSELTTPSQNHQPLPTEPGAGQIDHDISSGNSFDRRAALLAVTAAFSIANADMPFSVESAMAAERPKVTRVAVPDMDSLTRPSVADTREVLEEAGFKKTARIIRTGKIKKYPQKAAGKDYVVVNLEKKIKKRIKRGDETITIDDFDDLPEGSKQNRNLQIYLRLKLKDKRPIDSRPLQKPVTPALGDPLTSPLPPNLTGTPPVVPENTSPEENQPTPETPLSPEIAAEVERIQARDTLYAPFLGGCTATIIRDSTGKEIGASSAAHCGLAKAERILGSDGKLYIVTNGEPMLQKGEDVNNLQDHARVREVFLPKSGDPDHDIAILATQGTMSQVINAYKASLVTDSELATLQPSERQAFISGFAVTHNDYTPGVTKRTNKALSILGRADVFTSNGQTITSTVMTGIKFQPGEPRCSFGESGASGRVFRIERQANGTQKVIVRELGTLSAFDDFTWIVPGYNGPDVKLERQRDYNIDFGPYQGACAFDKKVPTEQTGEVVTLVSSASAIPR